MPTIAKKTKAFKCQRCGLCCLRVGRTFWKHGNLTGIESGKPFFDCEELNKLALNGDHEDNGLACEMLDFVDNLAICKIERDYGLKYKPITCKEYPEEGESCYRAEIV